MGGKIPLSSPKDTEPLSLSENTESLLDTSHQDTDSDTASGASSSLVLSDSNSDSSASFSLVLSDSDTDSTSIAVQQALVQATPGITLQALQAPVTFQQTGDTLIDAITAIAESAFVSQAHPLAPDLKGLLGQEMTFNALNQSQQNISDGDLPILDKHPQSIRAFIKEQCDQLSTAPLSIQSASMQIAAILNGIARALATKLGDMRAQREIARQLIMRLDLGSMVHTAVDSLSPYETDFITANVAALSQSNPVMQYVHDELNSHDAAMYTITTAEATGLNSHDFYEELKIQAKTQIQSLHALNQNGNTISSANTKKLAFEDPAGMYSRHFFYETIEPNGVFKEGFHAKIAKLDAKMHELLALPAAQRHFGKYTAGQIAAVEKANKHQAKLQAPPQAVHGNAEDPPLAVLQTPRQKALEKIHQLDLEGSSEDNPEAILTTLEHIFDDAPITICRFASNMLARELSQPEVTDHVLKPGTATMGISMEDIVFSGDDIRYGVGNVRQKAQMQPGDIPYVPLLDIHTGEGAERKSVYPIFRNNKNHRFDAKAAEEANTAVFGSLCLDPTGSSHGFDENGKKAGTYGDVTLVLNNTVKNSGRVLYTNTDRGRGYTDLHLFLYSILQPDPNFVVQEQLIPGGQLTNARHYIPNALIDIAKGKPDTTAITQNLEVQIFMDVKLTKEHIQEVYFANSVDPHDRDAIKTELSLAPKNPAQGYPMNSPAIQFYQYEIDSQDTRIQHILHTLYRKDRDSDRPPITLEEIKQLVMLNKDEMENTLRRDYTTRKDHEFLPHFGGGKGAEFEEALRKLNDYMHSPRFVIHPLP